MPPPPIQTYHCILCTTLLLSTTHTLSLLPTRKQSTDNAIILPLSSPSTSSSPTSSTSPQHGTTILLNLHPPPTTKQPIIIRLETGFEKRILYRCGRCNVVVGYEIVNPNTSNSTAMEVDGDEKEEVFTGKILYLLPNGLMTTEVMMMQGGAGGGVVTASEKREGSNVVIGPGKTTRKKIGEGDLEIVGKVGVGVFE